MAVFGRMEYHFEVDFRMHQVPNAFLEMLDIHDHLPQALVLMVGTNDIGVATKAQAQARAEDMLTDITAMWEKVKPTSMFCLGLFVSLLPPQLWYKDFHQQRAEREARCSLNSHLGKIMKEVQAVDLRRNPTKLSEPGYDILIQDIC